MWATTSVRRNQVASAEGDTEDLNSFQRKISDLFSSFLPSQSSNTDAIMSIAWLRKLLDVFLCCNDEFKATLLTHRDPSHLLESPLDRLIPDLLDRMIKSLDICNAINHGVESLRFAQKHAEIAVSALQEMPFTDGQIRRANKALGTVLSTIEEKESHAERSWSLGRRAVGSSMKQIQAIFSNLNSPGGADSTGLATPVYIMSVVLALIMWAMAVAIPCQERAEIGAHGPVPKQPNWAHGMWAVQEKIAEEWRKKERPNGLMEEVSKLEKAAQSLAHLLSGFRFPMGGEKEDEVADHVAKLAEVCARMEDGLGPLQRHVREVFHRMVRSRGEVLDVLDQASWNATHNCCRLN